MGVIQNSLNQAIATVVGAGLASKHLTQQAEANRNSELREYINLKHKDTALDTELSQLTDAYDADKAQMDKGKFKAFMPGDTDNPIWISKDFNPEEFKIQEDALKRSQKSINNKGLESILIKNRIKELEGKYDSYITEKGQALYEPETKPKKEKGVF